jgi:hypothetical protein
MSKKYQDLVKKYEVEVAEVRQAKARLDEAKKKFKAFNYDDDDDDIQRYAHSEELDHEWQLANQEYQIVASKLTQDIEAEYWDVPFAKARKQGIEKFWELVGI